jgi:uncharacterized protein
MKNFPFNVIRSHPVYAFFLFAYIISWVFWIPMTLLFPGSPAGVLPLILVFCGTFGPVVSAVILAWVLAGRKGIEKLVKHVTFWRVRVRWYLVALCLPLLVILAGLALFIASGNSPGTISAVVPWYLLPVVFVFALITGGPLVEEPGWRGFALPFLLESKSPLFASLLLGVVWSLWHLPLFFISWSSQFGLSLVYYVIMNIGFATLITWVFISTKESVLPAMILHTSFNVAATLLPVSPAASGSSLPFMLIAVIMCCAAAVVVVIRRREFFSVQKGLLV